jgi:segregation and condensation protein A
MGFDVMALADTVQLAAPLRDGLIPDEPLKVQLPVFEGPLDLLLYLIKKNEIAIYDIPIEQLTTQYLETLRSMHTLHLEFAGEFFVMAATLLVIKSEMLLPRPQDADHEVDGAAVLPLDPRASLVEQLLDYQRYKEAAERLHTLLCSWQGYTFREGEGSSLAFAPPRALLPLPPLKVWETFNRLAQYFVLRMHYATVQQDTISVAGQMSHILNLLSRQEVVFFSVLLGQGASCYFVAVTFLATLELCKVQQLRLEQAELFGDIACVATDEQQPPSSGAEKD